MYPGTITRSGNPWSRVNGWPFICTDRDKKSTKKEKEWERDNSQRGGVTEKEKTYEYNDAATLLLPFPVVLGRNKDRDGER